MHPIKLSLFLLLAFINLSFKNAQDSFTYTSFDEGTLVTGNQDDTFILPKDMVLKIIPSVEKSNLPFVFFISGNGG